VSAATRGVIGWGSLGGFPLSCFLSAWVPLTCSLAHLQVHDVLRRAQVRPRLRVVCTACTRKWEASLLSLAGAGLDKLCSFRGQAEVPGPQGPGVDATAG
jgi:hypothetical protein